MNATITTPQPTPSPTAKPAPARTTRILLGLLICWLGLILTAVASPPPTISGQPTNQTVPVGGTATFAVQASGNGYLLTYQWYFQAGLIPGATNSTFVVNNAQTTNAGSYYVAVNNGIIVNSSNATLTVTSTNPGSLLWNTFLGNNSVSGEAQALAVDSSGNIYVVGYCSGTWGTPLRAYGGGYLNAFVAKLTPTGSLVWNTFLGGSGMGYGTAISVDGSGNVYVAGYDNATWGSPLRAFSGSEAGYVAKLNSNGSLAWNTFLGGNGYCWSEGLALDTNGNVYVTGYSSAAWGSPVSPFGGGYDVFAAELNSSGGLTWNTFLGGTGTHVGRGIAVDGSGNVYLAGSSTATWGSPVTAFGGGAQDAFAAKLNNGGTNVWNTFLGGTNSDNAYGIAVDASGSVFVSGSSAATWGTPIVSFAATNEAFAAELTSTGSVAWNTFLGGTKANNGYGIALDTSGNVYVTGDSGAAWGNPVRAYSSGTDAFAAQLTSSGSLNWSTFLGGSGTDTGFAILPDNSGNIYVAGTSTASWGSPLNPFPGSNQYDILVAKVVGPPAPPTITLQPAGQVALAGSTVTLTVQASGNGYPLTYQWYFQSNTITGATNSNYVINNAQLTNAGTYFVTLNNGIGSVTSAPASLSVFASPTAAIWDGGGANNNWSTGSNWLANVVPVNNGTTNILMAGTTRLAPTVDASWSIAGLAFDPGAGAFTLGGGTLTLGANGITNFSANAEIISNNLVQTAPATFCANAGSLILSGNLTKGGSLTTFGGSGNVTVGGAITGGGGVVLNGPGTLVLSGNNTFSGNCTINGGTFQLGANNNLAGSLNFTLGSGTFAAAGYTESVGPLTLAATALIDLGGGNSVLQFAGSSGASWTPDATLIVTNWNGSYSGGGGTRLIFGSNGNGLSAGQVAQIGFVTANGIQPARLLASGEVVPVSADVAIAVSGPATVNVASNLTYLVTVTNLGPSVASNVVVSDTLPAGVTFVGASAGGNNSSGVVSWSLPALPAGATTNFTVTVTALTGTLTNIVSSTAGTADTNAANNNGSAANAQVVTTVIVNAALAGANCAQVAANSTLTWSQTVNSSNCSMLIVGISLRQKNSVVSSVTYGGVALTNLVSSRLKNAVEIWGLPAPPVGTASIVANWSGSSDMNGWSGVLTNVNPSNPVGATGGTGAGPGTPVSVTVNANAGDLVVDAVSTFGDSQPLTPGGGQTIICSEGTGTAPANGAGAGSDKAGAGSTTMSWTAGGQAEAWDIAAVVLNAAPAPPQADVVTTVSGPASAFAATNFAYTVLVTNAGPSTASNVVVSDALPPGVGFVGASAGGTNNNGLVTWPTLASLGSGASSTFTVNVTAPPGGSLTNSVFSTALTGDPNPTNNNGSATGAQVITTVIPLADIATTVSGPSSVLATTNFNYSIALTNLGPSAAGAVLVSNALPAGVQFVAASGGGSNVAGVVVWSLASFASGAATNFTVTANAPLAGLVTNLVTSTAATTDPNPANNNGSAPGAMVTTTVLPVADVQVTQTGPGTVFAASNLTYTITVTNLGPTYGTNLVVTDLLPAGVTFVSASGGGAKAGGSVSWTLASFASAATTNFTVTVTAPGSGTLTNVVSSTAGSFDPNAANNNGSAANAQVLTTVTPLADVVTTVTGPASVYATTNFNYTVTVTNLGPSTASNLVVSDPLPAGLTFVSASGGGTNIGGGPGQVVFDAASSNHVSGVTNWTHVTTSAANRLLLVGVSLAGNGSVSAVTYGGYNLTRVMAATNQVVSALWALVNPPSGANPVILTSTGAPTALIAGATTFSGVDPVTPLSATNFAVGQGSAPTVTISSASGQIVFDNVACNKNVAPTAGAGQTQLWSAAVNQNGGASLEPGTNSVTISWTLPSSAAWVDLAVSVKAAPVSGVMNWTLPSLASGAKTNFTVTVTAPLGGTLTNIVASTAATLDPNAANNNGSSAAAQVVTTVIPIADLVTTLSGPTSVPPLTNYTYAVAVWNQGPCAAATVAPTATLDPRLTFVGASAGGTYLAGVVTWPAVTGLASGATTNFTVTVRAPVSGTLTNWTASTADTTDLNSANNNGSAAAAQVITAVSPLQVANTSSGSSVQTLSWSHTISAGSSRILVVGVSVDSPSNAIVAATFANKFPLTAIGQTNGTQSRVAMYYLINPPVGSYPIAITLASASGVVGGAVSFNGVNQTNPIAAFAGNAGTGSLASVTVASTLGGVVVDTVAPKSPQNATAPGAAQSLEWNWSGSNYSGAGGTSPGAAAVSPSYTLSNADDWAMAAVALNPASLLADVTLTASGPASVLATSNLTCSITVTNLGNAGASNVVVSDVLPAGATFVSASSGGTNNGGVVSWPVVPNLLNGATTNYTVTITAPASGSLTNLVYATAITADPDPSNNNGTSPQNQVVTAVTPLADVATTVTGPATVLAATNFAYVISVTNQGPSDAANVTVSNTLPAAVSFVAASGGGANTAGVVVWSLPVLASGAATNFTVTVTAPTGGTLTNTVASTADTTDLFPANNNGSAATAQVLTTVTPLADVATTVTGPAAVFAGTNFAYVISVTNQGPSAAASITVSNRLPATVGFVSATGNGSNAAGVMVWSLPALAAGAATNFTITVTAPAGGTLTNSVSSTALTGDPQSANNDGSSTIAQVITAITPLADIATTVTGPAALFAGASYTYTISVLNLGPSAAASVLVSNTLPAGVGFVNASGGGTPNAGVVVWSLPSLATGAASNFTLTVTAPAGGSLTNTVTSRATTSDPNVANNDGSAANAQVISVIYPPPVLTGQWISGGGFQLQLDAPATTVIAIEASTNLVDWQTLLTTNAPGGLINFLDPDPAHYPQRFYRTRQ